MSDPAGLDATAQARLVRTGEVSAAELVDAAIARIEKLDPQINAVIHRSFEKARAQAASAELPDGPFRGVPMLLKDLLCHSAGDPFHAGMGFLERRGWVEERDTFLAARLRAAGFVFVGKANTSELGIAPTTEPEAYGATRNPWDPGRSAGGSSGGSAAAVAASMVPVAHGNDLGGSIRIPSSACGVVGLKPTRGRTSLGDEFGELVEGLFIEHVLTRSVRDTAAILDVVCGPMVGDPYVAPPPAGPFAGEVGTDPGRLRVGIFTRPPGIDVHPDCVTAARDAAALLESLGHTVEESYPPAFDEPECLGNFSLLLASWAAFGLDYWSRRTGAPIGADDVEPLTWALAERARAVTVPQYLSAVEWLQAWTRRAAAWWADGFNLLVTPTLGEPPPPLGSFRPAPGNPLAGAFRAVPFAPFTYQFNVTGQPAISLPLSWNGEGMPIGVQLAAAYGREDLLIRVASQLEQARPWAERRPPISA